MSFERSFGAIAFRLHRASPRTPLPTPVSNAAHLLYLSSQGVDFRQPSAGCYNIERIAGVSGRALLFQRQKYCTVHTRDEPHTGRTGSERQTAHSYEYPSTDIYNPLRQLSNDSMTCLIANSSCIAKPRATAAIQQSARPGSLHIQDSTPKNPRLRIDHYLYGPLDLRAGRTDDRH